MRITTCLRSAATATALIASCVAMAGPAGATTTATGVSTANHPKSHLALARKDWKAGARLTAAEENRDWIAARRELAFYGTRYFHERSDLQALINIPLTDTTAAQRATVARVTRELNGFFHTSGLYDVAAGNAKALARTDWIKSARVVSAKQNAWFAAAVDELDSYGKRYAKQRAELASLESIPLTDTTAKQRATARRDVHALDRFFHTPGLNT